MSTYTSNKQLKNDSAAKAIVVIYPAKEERKYVPHALDSIMRKKYFPEENVISDHVKMKIDMMNEVNRNFKKQQQ